MQLFLAAEDAEAELRSELEQFITGPPVRSVHPLLLETQFPLAPNQRVPYLVFVRQWLPNARAVVAESIRTWANELLSAMVGALPENQPWALHIEPHYGARAIYRIGARAWHSVSRQQGSSLRSHDPTRPEAESQVQAADAGRHRCELIREGLLELLQKKRRHLLRQLQAEPVPFASSVSLVQLLLTKPDSGFISLAPTPLPYEQRHLISPFPKGFVPMATDPSAPSRAFAKLVEAEKRLGQTIQPRDICVDLGAAPGSWTYVAVNRGARVIAVDRSPLREDLMSDPQVQFQRGDAFAFKPVRPVDWLLCDVIAAPEKSAELLLTWLRHGWCRKFVVTVKLKDAPGVDVIALLKRELPSLAHEVYLTHLCANKKELCAFGKV